VGQGGDLDLLVLGQVEEELHAAKGLGVELVSRVPRDPQDDVGAVDGVHAQQGVTPEEGVPVPPPAAELPLRHVGDQVLHAAEHGACGPA
jgi:hypothetical protein